MRWLFLIFISFNFLGAGSLFEFLGGQKKGTTSLLFLKVAPGGAQVAMGGVGVSMANDATCLYWNPSLASFVKSRNSFAITYRRWVVDQNYAYIGGIKSIGKYQRVGLYMLGLSSGYFEETDENHPYGTGRYITSSDVALGLVYSRNVSDRFAFGLTFKFAYENLAGEYGYTGLLDVGTLYEVGYRDVQIGVSLSNLGPDFSLKGNYISESGDTVNYDSYSVPVIYRIGAKGKLKDWLLGAFEIEKPSDDVEEFKMGFSFIPVDYASFNIGFRLNNTPMGDSYFSKGVNFGFTVHKEISLHRGFYISYTAEQMGYLGVSHVITTGVNF